MGREIDGGSPVVRRSITANVGHGAHGSEAVQPVGNDDAGEEEVSLPGWNLKVRNQTLHVLERRFAMEIHLAMLEDAEHPRLQRTSVTRPEVVVTFDLAGEPWVQGDDLLEPAFERKEGKAGQSEEREREERWQRTSF